MRKLASIQRITKMENIPGTDTLAVATIKNWRTIVKKYEMAEGDLVVYFEIDSVCPDTPDFEFMKHLKHRVKAIKLRGLISQGLAMPTSILGINPSELTEDYDVTPNLGITKYKPKIPVYLGGRVKGPRPSFVPLIKEPRIQSHLALLEEINNKEVYISTKVDGSHMSVYHTKDNKFGVCNRHYDLRSSYKSTYWKMVRKLDIFNFEALKKLPFDILGNTNYTIVIQGELAGPGIQRNKLGLAEIKFLVFNIWIDNVLMPLDKMIERCKRLGLDTVPIEDKFVFEHSLDWLLERAKGKYESTNNEKEGIIIRPLYPIPSPTLRFSPLTFSVSNSNFDPKV